MAGRGWRGSHAALTLGDAVVQGSEKVGGAAGAAMGLGAHDGHGEAHL